MENFYLAALQYVNNCGYSGLSLLLEACGNSAERLWEQSDAEELKQVCSLEPELIDELMKKIKDHQGLPERIFDDCTARKVSICTIYDSNYPELLAHIANPPFLLYYRGHLEEQRPRIAMVGSRRVSPYGRAAAEKIATELTEYGFCIVSGAAYGVDTCSHKGALKFGVTEAVLGCGVDIAYPATNRRMLDKIAEQGAVISEYPPGEPPVAWHFPMRNRIISGMCQGTVIVEAAFRSGSLITAEQAISEGRDVFAVPGSIFTNTSKGTNKLIQSGAKLVTGGRDIAIEYHCADKTDKAVKSARNIGSASPLTAEEEQIWKLLSADKPLTIDEIIIKLQGSDVANVAFILLQLTLKGAVAEDELHRYTRAVN